MRTPTQRSWRIALLNPNTNADTTQMMLGIAQQALPPDSLARIEGALRPAAIASSSMNWHSVRRRRWCSATARSLRPKASMR